MHAVRTDFDVDVTSKCTKTMMYLLIHNEHRFRNQVLFKLLVILYISFGRLVRVHSHTSGASSIPTLCSTKELKISR